MTLLKLTTTSGGTIYANPTSIALIYTINRMGTDFTAIDISNGSVGSSYTLKDSVDDVVNAWNNSMNHSEE
jgi:hypothetical protein